MPVSACMGNNTHWVLDKFPNGKIRLPIGIEHNTHTRTDARRNNGALTHIHSRTQSSLSYNQTPNRFGYTAVRAYCVIECACVFVWVFCRFFFHRICVKLCRQSVAKWHDKMNNTIRCEFRFEAHVTCTQSHSHMWWSYRADLIWFLSFSHNTKATPAQTHWESFKIKLYL